MKSVLATICILLSLCNSVNAHSWYPAECCHDQDCRPVPCDELIEQKDGSIKYSTHVFPKGKIRPSQDSMCHVCLSKTYEYPYCVFIQNNF